MRVSESSREVENNMRASKQKGVTLIEMLVVVVIIGVLASVAYPSYTEHQRTGNRASAKASLMKLHLWMEEQFSLNGAYPTSVDNNSCPSCTLDTAVYTFSASFSTSMPVYTLTATPIRQTIQGSDRCGVLSVDASSQTHAKLAGVSVSGCW